MHEYILKNQPLFHEWNKYLKPSTLHCCDSSTHAAFKIVLVIYGTEDRFCAQRNVDLCCVMPC